MLPNLALPFPTKFLAIPARSIGAFGLVTVWFTIPYHVADLGQTRPRDTFTNHYRRGQETHN